MNAVDLFAGCGGLSLGIIRAGVNVSSAYDNWLPAVTCYQTNFNHPIISFDLTDVSAAVLEIGRWMPDMIMGGPPCQDFSHAGLRSEGSKAKLTQSFARIVASVRPTWFLMENVDRIQKSESMAEARLIFKEAGYGLSEHVLNASYCGVPQRRKRFFCIGRLDQQDGFMGSTIAARLSSTAMTLRDYLGDALGVDYYYRHPRNYSRRAVFSIDEPAATIRGVNRPIPKGYHGHPGDAVALGAGLRPLTTAERALVQTFPPKFQWIGSKTDIEQIVGNAVPPKLAEFVGNAIMSFEAQLAASEVNKVYA